MRNKNGPMLKGLNVANHINGGENKRPSSTTRNTKGGLTKVLLKVQQIRRQKFKNFVTVYETVNKSVTFVGGFLKQSLKVSILSTPSSRW